MFLSNWFYFIFSLCELLKYSIGISIPQPISWIRASLEWNPFGRLSWRALLAGRPTTSASAIRAASTVNTVPDAAAAAAKSYPSSSSFYFCSTSVLRWIAELNWKTKLSFYVFVKIFIKIDSLNSSLFWKVF